MGNSRLSTKKKIVFLSIAILFGIFLGLIASEIGLRIAGPAWLRQFMIGTNLYGQIRYGTDAGWPVESRGGKFVRFKPGKQFNVNYYEYNTTIHTDEWGGRVVPDAKKKDNLPVVPVLGDSFTFGLGVKDNETFVNLMCKNLDAVYVNLGAPGSALPNQLDIVEFRHKDLGSPPLYIFVFYLGNDFSDMIKYYEGSKNDESQNSGIITFIENSKLIQRSYLVQFVLHHVSDPSDSKGKHKTRYYHTPDGKRISNSVYLLMAHSKPYSVEVENVLNRSLDRLEDMTKNLHFRAEFIIIPDKHQSDPYHFNKQASVLGLSPDRLDRSYPDRFLEEHLEQRGIPYLDLMACLKDRPGMYFKIDDHFTAAGHRAAADCIHHNAGNLKLPGLQIAERK
jgi:hypothetical protein